MKARKPSINRTRKYVVAIQWPSSIPPPNQIGSFFSGNAPWSGNFPAPDYPSFTPPWANWSNPFQNIPQNPTVPAPDFGGMFSNLGSTAHNAASTIGGATGNAMSGLIHNIPWLHPAVHPATAHAMLTDYLKRVPSPVSQPAPQNTAARNQQSAAGTYNPQPTSTQTGASARS